MKRIRIALQWLTLTTAMLSHVGVLAAKLPLQQAPAGSATEPAPNIIVSVDDSGSMGASGIATLKAALTRTFSVSNVIDGKVRLAWQSMNRCRGIPSSSTDCGSKNGIKPLQGTHRTNFLTWVNTLAASGPTPSHLMIDQAGQYLSRTDLGINSPWAANPGVSETPVLSCRKSFHIFMTDGVWNSTDLYLDDVKDGSGADRVRIVRGGGNADNIAKSLPTGPSLTTTVTYSITSDQTRIYRDQWGSNTLSTFADLAFHYWSTDLQPTLTNNVLPTINREGTESFGGVTLQEFWNPRNNPAVWQHMVTYTIGFDPDGPTGPAVPAGAWNGAPAWGGDTYSGGLPSLASGTVTWPTPLCGAGNTGTGNLPCDNLVYWTGSNNAWGVNSAFNPVADGRRMELWHAALNGRGKFVPAPNDQALVDAFQGILDDIFNQTGKSLVSIAASTSRLRSDSSIYLAGYKSDTWSGQLGAYPITAAGDISPTPTWTVSTLLDSTNTLTFDPGTRLVLTHDGTNGRSFEWANLSAAQQSLLQGSDSAAVGADRVSYLRGNINLEARKGGSMRNRNSRLGDIINSNIWLTGKPTRLTYEHFGHKTFRTSNASRTPTLYVGANDGMLHAFNATNGREMLAYVPKAAYSQLRNYTLPNYTHKYFVDGSPFTGDVDVSGRLNTTSTLPAWRTVLISGMGAGGKGYFGLDVTNPATWTSPGTGTTTQVLFDRTLPVDATGTTTTEDEINDIGHIFSQPVVDPVSGTRSEQIVKLNNGRWAVVMGNGYNSHNERPVLLIQYLDGDRSLKRIVASSTTNASNGLSAPRLVDVNDDGRVDMAYAGDLKGNLWKFNLSSASPNSWGVSFSGNPLYVASDSGSNRQPITTAPMWMSHPMGGVQVLFGTGINVTESHQANSQTQTVYSVWDKSTYSLGTSTVAMTDIQRITTGRSALVAQTVVNAVTKTLADTSTVDTDYFNTTENNVSYSKTDATAKRGWFFDLPLDRERVLVNPMMWEGQKVVVASQVPKLGTTGETCDFSQSLEDNWINVFNMITGKPSVVPAFSTSDTTMNLKKATRTRFGSGDLIALRKADGSTELVSPKPDDPDAPCEEGKFCAEREKLTTGTGIGARSEWREVQY